MCKLKNYKLIVRNNSSNLRGRDEIIVRTSNIDLRLMEEILLWLIQQTRLRLMQKISNLKNKEKSKHCIRKNKQTDDLNKSSTFFEYIEVNMRLAKQVQRAMLLNVVKTLMKNFKNLKTILALPNNLLENNR